MENNNNGSGLSRLPVPAIAAACVLFVGLAGFLGYRALTPTGDAYATETRNTDKNKGAVDNQAWLKQKAQETGGDAAKLSAEDRAKLDRMTRGNSVMVLKMTAQGR
jgi:hypothetical protein